MLDHIGIEVSDYHRSKEFYETVLAPLGYELLLEVQGAMGFGKRIEQGPVAQLWLHEGPEPARDMHIAFTAKTRAQVDAFYQAALAAGGEDNGAPGLRPMYHANYYGAFIYDPDGYNIEAVCHAPEKEG
ncbi:MAG: VOC family protein [Gammaproteobacteria bacterium]|nr:VOC family protein [Gammaproteobacteria bacterium]